MVRVLMILSSLVRGGTELTVLNYVRHMERREVKIDFLVLYGDRDSELVESARNLGCDVFFLPASPSLKPVRFLRYQRELKRFFSTHTYSIVQIHSMTATRFDCARAAKRAGVKTVIFHSHTSAIGSHPRLHRYFRKRLKTYCDEWFACSEAAGKYMFTGAYRVVPNAVELDRYRFCPETRKKLVDDWHCEGKLVIGHIGRLVPVKNHRYLLQIADTLKKKGAAFRLFLIGDGPELEALQTECARRDLTEEVVFVGRVGKPATYYNLFDVLAFPSLFEGLSLVTVEAQANGCPIIASDRISRETALTEEVSFLPLGDDAVEAWCNALLKAKRADSGQQIAVLAAAGYEISAEAKKLENFYLGNGWHV